MIGIRMLLNNLCALHLVCVWGFSRIYLHKRLCLQCVTLFTFFLIYKIFNKDIINKKYIIIYHYFRILCCSVVLAALKTMLFDNLIPFSFSNLSWTIEQFHWKNLLAISNSMETEMTYLIIELQKVKQVHVVYLL